MKYIFALLFISTVSFGQQKEQNGRYQIIQITSLKEKVPSWYVAYQSSGAENDLMCLDTQTGKTWLLTSSLQKITDSLYVQKHEWTPLPFIIDEQHPATRYYEPPKELKKSN